MKAITRYALMALGGGGMLAYLVFTEPKSVPSGTLAGADGSGMLVGYAPDGARVLAAAGCGSCHATDGTEALAGGKAFETPFGTFYAPNISSHWEHGIGQWSELEFADAVLAGVTPDGSHYFPAFPYSSYNKMDPQDLMDLFAHLRELPADATPSRSHDLTFPFNFRRPVGIWKELYVSNSYVLQGDLDQDLVRGRYLVEAMGHCAECHTPRNALGGLQIDQWMRGAPNPSGDGTIPSIHPDDLGWSAQDIEIYLDSGFTPDFDTVGGSMVDVVDNTAKLTDSDRAAIAAYLLALD